MRRITSKKCRMGLLALSLVTGVLASWANAAEPALKAGDFVAVCGDSITEQKQYSVFIEDYLLMCRPVANTRTMQFGWSGDTAGGFVQDKLTNDVLRFHPTVMTTCYGMNDGRYGPLLPEVAKWYRESTQTLVDMAKQGNVRTLIIGSPGVVDSTSFRKDPAAAKVYNETLASLSDIAKEVAEKNGVIFANVHQPMMDAMAKAKAKYGDSYDLAGGDGVHPGANGHLVMAYAFLKAMGCDGALGTITVDLSTGKATTTDGHQVISSAPGTVEIESSRYPFCFNGKPEDPNATSGVIEFFPFNEDLNRFTLVVTNPSADKLKVTWGKVSKEFTKTDLAKGINLAAEFLDNPFSAQFMKVHNAVAAQQNFETMFIKNFIFNIPAYASFTSEENKPALELLAADGGKKAKTLFDSTASLVTPVRHTITVEAVK